MNAPDYLSEILCELADSGVQFVVAGGVAAVLHGVERATMDLDLAIQWDDTNVRRFTRAMMKLGLEPKMPVPVDILENAANLKAMMQEKGALVCSFRDPDDPIRLVDLFIRPELSYDVLSPDAVSISLHARVIRIVSKRKLLALKQQIRPPRPKDELDISTLKAMMEQNED